MGKEERRGARRGGRVRYGRARGERDKGPRSVAGESARCSIANPVCGQAVRFRVARRKAERAEKWLRA